MLKTILAALLLTAALAAAADKPPAGIPTGAQRLSETRWRHTTPDGKSWIFTRTPFGWSRGPETTPAAGTSETKESTTAPALEVVEIRANEAVFQRPTPFGRSRWTKALSALDEAESAAVAAARNKSSR